MRTYHIRRQLKKARGNQFYRDRTNRSNGTYCGIPETEMTDHDIRWNDKSLPFEDWVACGQCVKARRDEATQAVKTTLSANEAIPSGNADLGDKRKRADRLAYQIDGFDAWCKLIDEIRLEEKALKT